MSQACVCGMRGHLCSGGSDTILALLEATCSSELLGRWPKDCLCLLQPDDVRIGDFVCLLFDVLQQVTKGADAYKRVLDRLMEIAMTSETLPRTLRRDEEVTSHSPDPIAEGGFGEVYRALMRDSVIAVKAPKWAIIRDEKKKKALYREIVLWTQLVNDNLLPFLGICTLERRYPSVISPWMNKGTAIDFLKQRTLDRSSDPPQKLRLLAQVAAALSYLHNHSPPIIHHDVRGPNVLINDNDNAVLGDFGLSRIDDELFRKMESTVKYGNPRWQAPEVMFPDSSREEVSPFSDMWSFGMLCIEMITEKLPYSTRATHAAVILAVYKGRLPVRPSDAQLHGLHLSEELWGSIQRCWRKKPRTRCNAAEMQAVLETAIAGLGTLVTAIDVAADNSAS